MFNPYFNPYNNYNNYNFQQQIPVMKQNNFNLQGKSIDNLEVVKAMDIPLDRKY